MSVSNDPKVWHSGSDMRIHRRAQMAVEVMRQARATTLPIIFLVAGNPIVEGLVTSLARPGGNMTGLSSRSTDLIGKQLELLKQTD